MSAKTNLGLFVAVVVAAGLAIRSWNEHTDTQRQIAIVGSQQDDLRGRAIALEKRLQSARSAIADLGVQEATLPATGAPTQGAKLHAAELASAKPAATARKLSPASLVANDPKKMAEYAKNYRESLDLSLGAIFRKLGLTPEQIEKVKDLTAWYAQRRMDLQAAAEIHGLFTQGPEFVRLWNDLGKERRKREAELFGEGEMWERYDELQRNFYLRETTRRIASIEMGADTPATFAQVERATEIILGSNLRSAQKDRQGKFVWQGGAWSWQDWAAIDWTAAGPQLQRELSPVQYTRLRQMLHTQEAWTAVATRNTANQLAAQRLARKLGR